MIVIGDTVISEDIADKFFVCDLSKCKGACCVEGDAGAPLLAEELPILKEIYENVKPYLSRKGREAIEAQGLFIDDGGDEYCTPTIDNKECAYAIYDKGILKCAIEKAYNEGKVSFKKPISCHLYPIRITKYDHFEALNYERWHICNQGCIHGEKLGVPLYSFLREPLIRKFGLDWYKELEYKVGERGE